MGGGQQLKTILFEDQPGDQNSFDVVKRIRLTNYRDVRQTNASSNEFVKGNPLIRRILGNQSKFRQTNIHASNEFVRFDESSNDWDSSNELQSVVKRICIRQTKYPFVKRIRLTKFVSIDNLSK